MTDKLFIFAEITPKPEHLSAARDAILDIVERTRNEKGCRAFNVLEGIESGEICLFEEWNDQSALDAHYAKPYTAAVFAHYEQWLEKPPEIKKLSSLG